MNAFNLTFERNFALLSFGADAAREEAAVPKSKVKSSHDILGEAHGLKEESAPIKIVGTRESRLEKATEKRQKESDDEQDNDEKFNKRMKAKVLNKKKPDELKKE